MNDTFVVSVRFAYSIGLLEIVVNAYLGSFVLEMQLVFMIKDSSDAYYAILAQY